MAEGTVCVAYVHDTDVAHSWHQSMIELLGNDMSSQQRILNGGLISMRCGTGSIVDARNKAAAQFLDGEAEWLWWIDTDMGFAADTVDRLVEVADPVERPIVGALCFKQRESVQDGMHGFRCIAVPTLYGWGQVYDREGFVPWWDYPRDELVKVAATGSACVLIHRDVLTKVGEASGNNWYGRVVNPTDDSLLSEDLSFCARARQAGFDVHADTRVKTSHLKQLWLSEADYEMQLAAAKHLTGDDA